MTEQLNLWKAALEVAFDQTCSVGRPNDRKLIKDALDSVNAALTQPAQQLVAELAEGGEATPKRKYTEAEMHKMRADGTLPKVPAWLVFCDGESSEWTELRRTFGYSGYHSPMWMPLQFVPVTAPPASQEQADEKHQNELTEALKERDTYHEWADELADAIAKHTGHDIGEHSSDNNPWRMALNALECHQRASQEQEVCLTNRQQPSGGEVVTPESALEAIEYVAMHNGPGRSTYAKGLLKAATPKPESMTVWLVRDLLKHIEQNTCTHEETHRGGAIWEICNACGSMWADDKGGKPEFVWPDVVERAREYIAHHRITEGEA
jgi:hypothetical protein